MSFKKLLAHIRVKNGVSDDVVADLKLLGINNYDPRTQEDKVYDAFVSLWKQLKAPPHVIKVADAANVKYGTMTNILARLLKSGRLTYVRKGVYVPVMRKGK